jgi:flagellar basal-body rod modification protein FlgD
MASSVNALMGSSAATAGASQSTSSITGVTPSKDMFLQLLVAQIKNQDPLNPSDGTQFVAQLAQFSELEQVIAIRGDLDAQATAAAAAGTSGVTGTTGTTGTSGTTATNATTAP